MESYGIQYGTCNDSDVDDGIYYAFDFYHTLFCSNCNYRYCGELSFCCNYTDSTVHASAF